MTVKELKQELEKFDPETKIIFVKAVDSFEWEYTDQPNFHVVKGKKSERLYIC